MDISAIKSSIIPSYLYDQYSDDKDLSSFVYAYNQMAQESLSFVDCQIMNSPIYKKLSGNFLTWIGENLYGLKRPIIKKPGEYYDGMNYDNKNYDIGSSGLADDDVYIKLLTWFIFKGDGKIFSILNLKRRIARWIFPENEVVDGYFSISLTREFDARVVIKIPSSNPSSETFQGALFSGALDLPTAYEFDVFLV